MKVKALKKFETVVDSTVNRTRKCDEIFEVDKARAEKLLDANLIVVVEEEKKPEPKVQEAEIHTAVVEEKKVKKAVKKSTKKK